MNLFKSILFLCILFFTVSANSQNKKNSESVVPFGDPFIMLHDNTYYAYGTNDADGIAVYSSKNLKTWTKASKLALHKNDSWADRWFWAPEVFYIKKKNKFFMYYSADEHICVATSDSPLGPFLQEKKEPMRAEKGIDNSLFIDEDGKAYLYFVRFTNGNVIWAAELENDLTTIKEETLKLCFEASEPWETSLGKVAEGPSVIKHKGIYYLIYSANDYQSPDYGVGYATSSSPLGPWKKYEKNPILQKPDPKLVGTGHGAPFLDKNGKYKYAFHAHYNTEKIHPRGMYTIDISFSNDAFPIMKMKGIKPSKVVK
ncbi:MAG: glycoside hydrolase family 43 protein [Dysgonomonas sp.]